MIINAGVKFLTANGSEGWTYSYWTGIRIQVRYLAR